MIPLFKFAILFLSMSAPMTSLPSSANTAAVPSPTYPTPITATFICLKNRNLFKYLTIILLYRTMTKKKISITINDKILSDIDSIIDNIYIRNRSQAIEHLVKNSLGENKNAVILLGGDENHLKISQNEYRPIAKIKNSSLIEVALRKLRENNFKTIFVVARHNLLTRLFE